MTVPSHHAAAPPCGPLARCLCRPPDAYLLCSTAGSGSTLLCGLLRSTGVAGLPESYFRLANEQSWADKWELPRNHDGAFDYWTYVQAAVAAGGTPNGVFGARVMWGTFDELIPKLGSRYADLASTDLDLLTAAFGRSHFIHLWREDSVAQGRVPGPRGADRLLAGR